MPSIAKRAIFATIGAIAFGNAGTGSAAAADVPFPQAQVVPQQVAPPQPGYYAPPPVAQGYAVPPPAYYPPPPAYYAYAPAPVVVAPGPYYWGRRFGPTYGPYGYYVAHGYGRYERPWGHGYRRW
jgi:hypothetical protein